MKECKYCGTKYKDELDVCPNCGGNLIVTAEEFAEVAELAQKERENQKRSVIEPQDHLKKLIGIIAGIIAAVIVIVVVASYGYNHHAVNGDFSRADMAEAYEQGVAYYNSKDYVSAITELGKVSTESKYYDKASVMLQDAVAIYSTDALNKASAYANTSDYKMACSILENALQVVPANSTLMAELASYQETIKNQLRSSTLEAVEASIAENDYPTAIQTLSAALDELGNDIELNALLEKYSDEYRDMIIAQADEALENDGYEAAIGVVTQGLAILSNDIVLMQAVDHYEIYKPIWLCDLNYFNQSSDIFDGIWNTNVTATDNTGVEHLHSLNLEALGTTVGHDWISYLVDGKYQRVSGIFMQEYRYRSSNKNTTLKILGDDKVLWQGTVSGGIRPISFDIDISAVDILKFELTGSVCEDTAIGDICLYP